MDIVVHHISNYPIPWFDYIWDGTKKYEGRLFSKIKEWDLKIGKRLVFGNSDSSVMVEVTSLELFDSFGDAFNHPDIGRLLVPIEGINSDGVDTLYSELGFTKDKVREAGGVVIIGIEVVR